MTHSCHSHLLLLGCHISKIECRIYGEIKTDYILMYIELVCCEVIFFLLTFVGKKRRLTFIECNNDINSMIDLAKVADLVSAGHLQVQTGYCEVIIITII